MYEEKKLENDFESYTPLTNSDLINNFLYKDVFILHQKNPSFDEEFFILEDRFLLYEFLANMNLEDMDIPEISHGIIIPISYLDDTILIADEIKMVIATGEETTEAEDYNLSLGSGGVCLVGRVLKVVSDEYREKNRDNDDRLFEKITSNIESRVEEMKLDPNEFYLFVGYPIKPVLSVDNDSVDADAIILLNDIIDGIIYKEKSVKYKEA